MFQDKAAARIKAKRHRRTVKNTEYGVIRKDDNAYKPRNSGYKSSYT